MVYGTRAAVLSYCGRLAKTITSTSVPALTDLDTFLADRSSEIDNALKSRGLTTPVTTPAELVATVTSYAVLGAAGNAMLAAYITNDTNDRGTGGSYLKQFTDFIARIIAGKGVPVGAAVAEPDLAPRSYFTDAGAVGGGGPAGGSSSTPGWEWNDDPSNAFPTGTDQFGQPVSAAPIFTIGQRF